MKRSRPPVQARPRGAAAIELSILLVILMLLLPSLMLIGRVFYQYSMLKSACHSAAVYMATLPLATFRDPEGLRLAQATATRIVTDAAANGGINSASILSGVGISCDNASCNAGFIPQVINVNTTFVFSDLRFSNYNSDWVDNYRNWYVPVYSSVMNTNINN